MSLHQQREKMLADFRNKWAIHRHMTRRYEDAIGVLGQDSTSSEEAMELARKIVESKPYEQE
jgi:hypothetical protein